MNGPKKNNEPITDEQVERLIHDALRRSGQLPPTTVEEIARLEEEIGEYPEELPDSLKDPVEVLRRRRQALSLPKPIPFLTATDAQANLARAAREGGKIPAEVEEQMKRDKEAAKGESETRS